MLDDFQCQNHVEFGPGGGHFLGRSGAIVDSGPRLCRVRLSGGDPAEHQQRAEEMFAAITGQGARLPSQRRYEARARSLAEGAAVPRALYAEILALAG